MALTTPEEGKVSEDQVGVVELTLSLLKKVPFDLAAYRTSEFAILLSNSLK